jgi:hypothetical protein
LSRNESDLSKEKINNLQDIVIENKKAVRPRDSATPPRSGVRGIRSERMPQCNTIIWFIETQVKVKSAQRQVAQS